MKVVIDHRFGRRGGGGGEKKMTPVAMARLTPGLLSLTCPYFTMCRSLKKKGGEERGRRAWLPFVTKTCRVRLVRPFFWPPLSWPCRRL